MKKFSIGFLFNLMTSSFYFKKTKTTLNKKVIIISSEEEYLAVLAILSYYGFEKDPSTIFRSYPFSFLLIANDLITPITNISYLHYYIKYLEYELLTKQDLCKF